MGYLIKEGVKSIFTHGFMSFATVTIITACLIIMGTFSLVAFNIDATIQKFEDENEILALVDETLAEEDVAAIKARLEAVSNVRETRFISRDEAWSGFLSDYEDESLFSNLGADVLRHRYVVYLYDLSLMTATIDALREVNGVAEVKAHEEIGAGFVLLRNIVSIISIILIVILLIVSVFIMSNTLKLATYGRREEIAIMKMVGAGNFFIRCPFVIEGLILGVAGGLIAFFIQWGIYTVVVDRIVTGIVETIIVIVPFATLALPIGLIFAGVGLVVGVFGSNIAIRNYLKV